MQHSESGSTGTSMVRQTEFTAGEVDITTYKRTDYQDYLKAAQSLLNAEVGTTGLAKKRRGMSLAYVMSAYAIPTSQMYEFKDKNGVFYLLLSANFVFHAFRINSYNNLTFIQTISTPYPAAILRDLDYSLSNDVLALSHGSYAPAEIYISNYTGPVFAWAYLVINPYPAYDFGNIDYNNFTVSAVVTTNVLQFNFTGVGADPGFTSAWIGGQILGAGNSVTSPLGYAIITSVAYSGGGGGTVTFYGLVQTSFSNDFAPSGSSYSIKQPAWSNALGWPACVLTYQNRLWFANTAVLPDTVFGSRINAFVNFDVGTGADTDAIIYKIGQANAGGILWMNGGKQLEFFTPNFEFAAPQEQNVGLTPGTFSIRQQSAYGSTDNIKPLTYINDSYYVSVSGNAIINYHFDGIGQSYTSTNISAASSHLVKNPINRALLRGTDSSQDNFIYYLNSDHTITVFQFAVEHKLAALTPMIFEPNIDVLDIVSINNHIYFLKKYLLTGVYALETFENIRMDSYITTTMASNGLIGGLSVLNGYTVQIVFNNQDYGFSQNLAGIDSPVSGGQCYAYNPNGYTGTVQVGLLYDFEVRPMYLFAGANASNYYKQITNIFVDYYNSLDFYINGTLVNFQDFAEIQAGLPLTPKTDTAIIPVTQGWERFGILSITQRSPFDCQITAIAYQISIDIV